MMEMMMTHRDAWAVRWEIMLTHRDAWAVLRWAGVQPPVKVHEASDGALCVGGQVLPLASPAFGGVQVLQEKEGDQSSKQITTDQFRCVK